MLFLCISWNKLLPAIAGRDCWLIPAKAERWEKLLYIIYFGVSDGLFIFLCSLCDWAFWLQGDLWAVCRGVRCSRHLYRYRSWSTVTNMRRKCFPYSRVETWAVTWTEGSRVSSTDVLKTVCWEEPTLGPLAPRSLSATGKSSEHREEKLKPGCCYSWLSLGWQKCPGATGNRT